MSKMKGMQAIIITIRTGTEEPKENNNFREMMRMIKLGWIKMALLDMNMKKEKNDKINKKNRKRK